MPDLVERFVQDQDRDVLKLLARVLGKPAAFGDAGADLPAQAAEVQAQLAHGTCGRADRAQAEMIAHDMGASQRDLIADQERLSRDPVPHRSAGPAKRRRD